MQRTMRVSSPIPLQSNDKPRQGACTFVILEYLPCGTESFCGEEMDLLLRQNESMQVYNIQQQRL